MSERIMLERDKLALTNHAYATGVLASSQFSELEELQTEHPTFIAEVVQTFTEEAQEMLGELRARLSAAPAADYGGGFVGIDFSGTRAVLHKLKGSALTLGACAVGACCEDMRQHCIAGNAAAIHAAGGPGSFAELVAKTQQVLGTLNGYTALHARICSLTE